VGEIWTTVEMGRLLISGGWSGWVIDGWRRF
jgi:hypothetical protein